MHRTRTRAGIQAPPLQSCRPMEPERSGGSPEIGTDGATHGSSEPASGWPHSLLASGWPHSLLAQTASAEAELPPFAPRIGLLGGNPAHTGFVAPRGVPKRKTRPGADLRSGPRAASAGFLIAAPYRRTPIRKGNGSPQRKRKMKSRMRKRIKSKSKSRNTT